MEREPDGQGEGRGIVWTALLTIASLVAFAGNSVLCRMALLPGEDGDAAIGAGSFTALRLLAGALVLAPVVIRGRSDASSSAPAAAGSAPHVASGGATGGAAAASLLVYALAFSLSYITLPAGVGALILFGTVQLVMIAFALRAGERLSAPQALGFAAAIAGMVVLVRPGVSIPWILTAAPATSEPFHLFSVAMMAIAGAAWASYTLLGRGATRPIHSTAANFVRCVPVALILLGIAAWRETTPWTAHGIGLSCMSGAVTSGAGYALWYAALAGHTRTSAAVVQLTVPVLAVLGGILLLDEELTRRVIVSGMLVLGGVGAVLVRRRAA